MAWPILLWSATTMQGQRIVLQPKHMRVQVTQNATRFHLVSGIQVLTVSQLLPCTQSKAAFEGCLKSPTARESSFKITHWYASFFVSQFNLKHSSKRWCCSTLKISMSWGRKPEWPPSPIWTCPDIKLCLRGSDLCASIISSETVNSREGICSAVVPHLQNSLPDKICWPPNLW